MPIVVPQEYDAVAAACIRTNGVTRYPTAFASPTQAAVTAADRAALWDHAAKRERLREQTTAAWKRFLRIYRVKAPTGEQATGW
jgi:hypothetical protein